MKRSGFTFLELLIALSLFTVAMVGILRIFPVNRRYLNQSALNTQATFLAQEEIETIRAADYASLTVGTTPYYEPRHFLSATASDPISQFERLTQISYVDPASNYVVSATDKNMKLVSVTVYWTDSGISRQYNLTSYVYHP